jgi:ribosome maturation factor RimP
LFERRVLNPAFLLGAFVMDRKAIAHKAESILGPLLEGEGFLLVDIDYKWERGGWTLRALIDREEGITLDDCARVSREFGQLLDVENVIPTTYRLEVSSPGLDRPLKKEKDFITYAGRQVRVRTRKQISGRRNFKGALLGCADGKIMVEVEGSTVFTIPISAILKANLVIELNRL